MFGYRSKHYIFQKYFLRVDYPFNNNVLRKSLKPDHFYSLVGGSTSIMVLGGSNLDMYAISFYDMNFSSMFRLP